MKLIGVMICRNEDWCLGASIPAALRWVDELVLVDHCSHDGTVDLFSHLSTYYPNRIWYSRWEPTKKIPHWSTQENKEIELEVVDPSAPWDEMAMRENSLLLARKHKATHVAIIDADEILTANLTDRIRGEFEALAPAMQLDVPMLAMRNLDEYQDDGSLWSTAWLTLGFADAPELTWKPAGDGYQHHHRSPYGITAERRFLVDKKDGGVMHLQFANRRRLLAKHWLYAYTDHLRWFGRETVEKLSWKYSLALEAPKNLSPVPYEWWQGHRKEAIRLTGIPWQEMKLRELIRDHGEKKFEGINLLERRPV